MGETVWVLIVKGLLIPSDLNCNFHLEYETSFHWNLIVFEESFGFGWKNIRKPPKVLFCFLLACVKNTRLCLSAVIVLL